MSLRRAPLVLGWPSPVAHAVTLALAAAGRAPRVLVTAADEARVREEVQGDIDVVVGDATAIDLGLAGPAIAPLAAATTHVFALSAAPRPSREGVRAVLAAAREAVSFAKEATAPLVYLSTALVAGDRRGTAPEEELDGRRDFGSPIVDAQARGERMVRAAIDAGLRAVILRPTLLTGHSQTGALAGGPFVELLASLRRPRADAGRDRRLHLVPVDWVARVALALAETPSAAGRAVHVADDRPISLDHLADLVRRARRAGGEEGEPLPAATPRPALPRTLKEAFFTTPGFERFAENPKVVGWWLSGPTAYSRANLVRSLPPDFPPCPPVESYIERLVERYESERRARKAARAAAAPEVEDPLA